MKKLVFILILCVLMSNVVIHVPVTKSSSFSFPYTYDSIRLYPESDFYLDSSSGTWTKVDESPIVTEYPYYFSYFRYNLSLIPDDAVIDNFSFVSYKKAVDEAPYLSSNVIIRICNVSEVGLTPTQIANNVSNGTWVLETLFGTWLSPSYQLHNVTTPSTAFYTEGSTYTICNRIQENLSTTDILVVSPYTLDSSDYILYKTSEDSGYEPYVYITYHYIATEASTFIPGNNSVDIDVGPNMSFYLSHPLGWNINDTVVEWLNGSTWETLWYPTVGSIRITINSTIADTKLANFPLCVKKTSDSLKDVNNGGFINTNGSDIYFLNEDNTSQLAHEIEKYNGTTGELIAWVNVSLNDSSDTIIYMNIGNHTSTNSHENPSGVWGEYTAVYHMNDSYYIWDSTGNYHMYNRSVATPINITGKIGTAVRIVGDSFPYNFWLPNISNNVVTLEAWWNRSVPFDGTVRYILFHGPFDGVHYGTSGIATYHNDYETFGYLWDNIGNNVDTRLLVNTGMDDNYFKYTSFVRNPNNTLSVQTNQTWYKTSTTANLYDMTNSTIKSIGHLFIGGIDEVRYSIGTARNESWLNATYRNIANTSIVNLSDVTVLSAPIVNGTYFTNFTMATELDHTYIWRVSTSTNATILYFTTDYPRPPTDLICHDYNETSLNISYVPDNISSYTTYTVCYYQEGSVAPTYGSGTLAGNVTGNGSSGWMNVTGLTHGTTYTFAFWTYVTDGTHGYLSSDFSYVTNTTLYGQVTFCLRNENSTDDIHHLLNLTMFNSTHQLIIKYFNSSETIQYLNWSTYIANDFTPNITVNLVNEPFVYELIWNYTVNDSVGNFSGQYKRILTPYADTVVGGTEYCTFYITTDKHVYNQYYLSNNSYVLEDDIQNLVDYSFEFDDQSGFFTPFNAFQMYASIYKYTGNNKIIIDQRYIDASGKISPTLIYQSYPFVGITSILNDEMNDYYENLGYLPTDKTVSPYTETITIYPLPSYYNEVVKNITIDTMWTSTGLWCNFEDSSSSTVALVFNVYNVSDNTLLYTKYVNGTSSYNITYTTTDSWHENITYKVNVVFGYRFLVSVNNYITKYYTSSSLVAKRYTKSLTSANYINYVLTEIFGDSPLYNENTGYSLPWTDTLIMFIGIGIFLSLLAGGSAIISGFSTGIYFIVIGSGFILDLSIAYLTLGIFFTVMTVIFLMYKGGNES